LFLLSLIYLSPNSHELDGVQRRFETLHSLGASSRRSLSDIQKPVPRSSECDNIFAPDRPVYHWFNELSRVAEGMGASFRDRSAVHLDLV
jgi:hypothetical protein